MKKATLLTVLLALSIVLGLSSKSFAAVSIQTVETKEVFEDVHLLENAVLNIDATQTTLKKVSHGLRKKAVFGLVPVRVYVLQLLAAQSEKLNKTEDGVLKSLKDAGPVILQITFLRDLPGSKISDAFKDGLESNKVNIKSLSPELEQVLKEVSDIKEFKKNESFSIAVTWKDKIATVYLQQAGSDVKTVTGQSEFADQLLSIWFGTPSDGKLGDLKKSLIK